MQDKPDETRDERLKRMRFQCRHRGMQEMDHILGGFADARLGELDDGQLDRLDALMMQFDGDVLRWILGTTPPPPEFDNDILAMLIAYKDKK